jgi:hypothetical protein
MVAAWISAETGVGPAMASGSQVCSGNCADFPATPQSSSSAMTVGWWICPAAAACRMPEMLKVPAALPSARMPNRKGTSPSLVTRNALMEAERASSFSQWCPTRKYEQMPMTSQPTSSTIRSPE